MIKRTIEISREPAHLSLRLGQLVLERKHEPVSTIPCEDLGMVVVDHPQVSYTHSALAELVERVNKARAAYLRWGRDTLGWAIYLFRLRPA